MMKLWPFSAAHAPSEADKASEAFRRDAKENIDTQRKQVESSKEDRADLVRIAQNATDLLAPMKKMRNGAT